MTTNTYTPNHRTSLDQERRRILRRITDLATQMRYAASKEEYVELARERNRLRVMYDTLEEGKGQGDDA